MPPKPETLPQTCPQTARQGCGIVSDRPPPCSLHHGRGAGLEPLVVVQQLRRVGHRPANRWGGGGRWCAESDQGGESSHGGKSDAGSKGAVGADLIFCCSSGSRAVGLMLAFCSKMAQQRGVAKVSTRPTRATWGRAGSSGCVKPEGF